MSLLKSQPLNDLAQNLETVFEAIDQYGWQEFGNHLPTDLKSFQDPTTLFDLVSTYVMQGLQQHMPLQDLENYSTHDRLLELFLIHCELLQPFKRGLVKIPFLEMTCFLKHMQSVVDTLRAMAGLDEVGLMGMVKGQGFKGVYVYGLYHWLEDLSPDLTGTMAAFDKALRWGETVIEKAKVSPLSKL